LFGSALLFWRPVLGADPLHRPAPVMRVAYLLSAMPFNDVIGVWLVASSRVQYPASTAPGLSDQRQAGVVMLAGSFVLGAAALAAAWSWIRLDERRAVLREQTE
jgi:cytochrome c oxidase assembly factor CtaG